MPVLCLLFRKPTDHFFSIEKIFHQLSREEDGPFHTEKVSMPYYTSSFVNIWKNLRYARRQRADVYHVTGDVHYTVLSLPRERSLLTIHDCVFMQQSTGIKRFLLKWLLLDLPVWYCRVVTTISEATKQDIIKYTGCRPDKIRVIPNPVSDQMSYVPAVFRAETPVILFIGSTPNKNLERVIRSLEGISCELKIIGKIPAPHAELLEQHRIRYSSRVGLTEEELMAEYTGADMVLFPSTFEGFGMPVIEAQKAGRPVITSNLSPMKEVAGDGACLVDPYDPDSIRRGILTVIGDKRYREDLIEKGFRNVARFSTEQIARQYKSCYFQLLAS